MTKSMLAAFAEAAGLGEPVMTVETLKRDHPAVVAELMAEGVARARAEHIAKGGVVPPDVPAPAAQPAASLEAEIQNLDAIRADWEASPSVRSVFRSFVAYSSFRRANAQAIAPGADTSTPAFAMAAASGRADALRREWDSKPHLHRQYRNFNAFVLENVIAR